MMQHLGPVRFSSPIAGRRGLCRGVCRGVGRTSQHDAGQAASLLGTVMNCCILHASCTSSVVEGEWSTSSAANTRFEFYTCSRWPLINQPGCAARMQHATIHRGTRVEQMQARGGQAEVGTGLFWYLPASTRTAPRLLDPPPWGKDHSLPLVRPPTHPPNPPFPMHTCFQGPFCSRDRFCIFTLQTYYTRHPVLFSALPASRGRAQPCRNPPVQIGSLALRTTQHFLSHSPALENQSLPPYPLLCSLTFKYPPISFVQPTVVSSATTAPPAP